MWLYNEAYQDERLKAAHAKAAGGSSGGAKTYPREKQDYEGQVCEAQQQQRKGGFAAGCVWWGGANAAACWPQAREGDTADVPGAINCLAWVGSGQQWSQHAASVVGRAAAAATQEPSLPVCPALWSVLIPSSSLPYVCDPPCSS